MSGLDNGCPLEVLGYWLMASAFGAAVASEMAAPVYFLGHS